MDNCCFGCVEREIGCHATCEKYKEFTDKLRQISKARYDLSRQRVATITMQKCMTEKIKKGRKNK